jgi:Leucine-rich repeat (LRR) protein
MSLRRLIFAPLLFAIACADTGTPVAPQVGTPDLSILDGAHGMGNQAFYFLPPLVPDPVAGGIFDRLQEPEVLVCSLVGDVCGAVVASFTMTTGTASEVIRVVETDEHYVVNWHTDQSDLDISLTYRIVVRVGEVVLGHADVDVVGSGRELRNVDTGEFVALTDGRTLPIKFRIEEGAIPTDPCVEVVFPDPSMDTAIRQLVGKPDGTILGDDVSAIATLDVRNQGVVSLEGIRCLTGLTSLAADRNQISNLTPLSDLALLEALSLTVNQITDISALSGLTSLTFLSLTKNPISDLASLTALTNLRILLLRDLPLVTDITPIAGMTELTTFWFGEGQIGATASVLQGLSKMRDLIIVSAGLADAQFLTGMPVLETLAISGNAISDLTPVMGLSQLRALSAEGNLISDLSPVSGLAGLTFLRLDGNPITDLSPLAPLTAMTSIQLRNLPGVSDLSPLSGMTGLQALFFGGGHSTQGLSVLNNFAQMTNLSIVSAGLSDLTFVGSMPLLSRLVVDDNAITDAVPLLGAGNLAVLSIKTNPISCLDATLVQLAGAGVTVIC